MTDGHLIRQDLDGLRAADAAIRRTVDALGARLESWITITRRIAGHLTESVNHAKEAKASFSTCRKAVDTIAVTLRTWKNDSSQTATEAESWNLRAKSALHEIGESLHERDTTHARLEAWTTAAEHYVDVVDEWIQPPAGMASGLTGLRDVTTGLRVVDPDLAEELIGAIEGLRMQTENDVKSVVGLIGKARTRARMANLPLRHARDEVGKLQRTGITGQAELTETVGTFEQLTADVQQISVRVDGFDAAVDQLTPLFDDLTTQIAAASQDKDTSRQTLKTLASRMAGYRHDLGNAVGLATDRLRQGISEREDILRTPSQLMAQFEGALDYALIEMPDRAVDAIANKIPESWIATVIDLQDTALEHAEKVVFAYRRTTARARARLPKFVIAKLDAREARATGHRSLAEIIHEMNADWRAYEQRKINDGAQAVKRAARKASRATNKIPTE